MFSQVRLTPAQKRFIERFDSYTSQGLNPRDFKPLREEWRIQSRTMNQCYRMGVLKKADYCKYIVDPEKRAELGLPPARFSRIIIQIKPRKRKTKAV